MENITLVLANTMTQGRDVIASCGLNEADCAVLNKPQYLDHLELNNNETIYAHMMVSTELLERLNSKLQKRQNVNIKLVNP